MTRDAKVVWMPGGVRTEVHLGGEVVRLAAGETVHIPKGVVHSGGNVGAGVGRRVVVFTPAGMEDFFLEAGASTERDEPDVGATAASAARYGWEFVTSP